MMFIHIRSGNYALTMNLQSLLSNASVNLYLVEYSTFIKFRL